MPDEDLIALIENRHRRRRIAMDDVCQKQAATLAMSADGGI